MFCLQVCGSEVGCSSLEVSGSPEVAERMSVRLRSHLKGQLGKDLLPLSLLRFLAELGSLQPCGLRLKLLDDFGRSHHHFLVL